MKILNICACLRTSVYARVRVRVHVCEMLLGSLFPLLSIASPSEPTHSLIHSLYHSLAHPVRCRSCSPRSWPRPWPAGLSRDSSPAGSCQSVLSEPAPWPRFLLLTVRRSSYETAKRPSPNQSNCDTPALSERSSSSSSSTTTAATPQLPATPSKIKAGWRRSRSRKEQENVLEGS